MIQEKARILEHKEIAPNCFEMLVSSSYLSANALPGQFAMVRCGETSEPLLRRPLSFHKIKPAQKIIGFMYEIRGEGTKLLSQKEVNDEIDILGPLGNGFAIDKSKQTAVLIGGGMGAAPLLALAEEIKKKTKLVYVIIGARTKNLILCEKDFRDLGCEVIVSTDDGSYGKKGLVPDILLDFINNQLSAVHCPLSAIYACGPKAMLKLAAEIAFQKKIDCQVSMEERMACGIGCCKGCPVETKSGYKMVCEDGPVFNANGLVW